MSRAFKPSGPFRVPMELMIPTVQNIQGTRKKVYQESGTVFFGSFRTFGGTEREVNNTIVREDTATIETWYRPDIRADCAVRVNGTVYEILGTPENIEMRSQWMVFKVRAVKGGA